jgi:hypothetical protein
MAAKIATFNVDNINRSLGSNHRSLMSLHSRWALITLHQTPTFTGATTSSLADWAIPVIETPGLRYAASIQVGATVPMLVVMGRGYV